MMELEKPMSWLDVVMYVSAVIAFGALAYVAVLLIMVDGVAEIVEGGIKDQQSDARARFRL